MLYLRVITRFNAFELHLALLIKKAIFAAETPKKSTRLITVISVEFRAIKSNHQSPYFMKKVFNLFDLTQKVNYKTEVLAYERTVFIHSGKFISSIKGKS